MKLAANLVLVLHFHCFCTSSSAFDDIGDFRREVIDSFESSDDYKTNHTDGNDPLLNAIASLFRMNKRKKPDESTPMTDRNQTQLSDLNTDVLFLILHELKFADLLNVAKTNARFAFLSKYVFKLKYSSRPIVIRDTFKYPREKLPIEQLHIRGVKIDTKPLSRTMKFLGLKKKTPEPPTHFEEVHSIQITSFKMIVDTFHYFDISNLELFYINPEPYQAKILGELITNYSSSTLETVIFHECSENTLEFIRSPLINVKTVKFHNRFPGTGFNTLPINELFPAVSRIYLDVNARNLNYFNSRMPNLRYLYLKGEPYIDTSNPNSHYEKILKKNPQIQSIELFSAASKSLQAINSLLPCLQNLTLQEFDLEGVDFCFQNVTKFNAKSSAFFPHKLQFPKLQSFFLELKEKADVAVWVEFLKRHTKVTVFHLKFDDCNDADFEELFRQLPNLLEMTFSFSSYRDVINIVRGVRLLEKHRNLSGIQVNCDRKICEGLRANFGATDMKWIITKNGNGLSFERS